jgi:hypothetical protein
MKKNPQRIKQPTPVELTDSCLGILRSKFYNLPGDDKFFHQDRARLLAWVVLWPASWLNKRGVTIHGHAYREIFSKVFLQAAAHVESKVRYRPAYLKQVIQSHFKIHGEEYYEAAKSVRHLVEQTMLLIGSRPQPQPDPVRELAATRDVLAGLKPKKRASQISFKSQLSLFGSV